MSIDLERDVERGSEGPKKMHRMDNEDIVGLIPFEVDPVHTTR